MESIGTVIAPLRTNSASSPSACSTSSADALSSQAPTHTPWYETFRNTRSAKGSTGAVPVTDE